MTAEIQTPATTTEETVTTPKMSGAEARARREAAKKGGTTTAPRPISPAPKPTGKGKKATTAAATPAKAGKAAKATTAKAGKPELTAEEKAAKDKAATDAALQREAARQKRANEKTEKENARKEREQALHAILGQNEFPAIDRTILLSDLAENPELAGANPSDAFKKSIKNNGVLEPITLLVADEDSTDYVYAGGRRRTAAAISEGLSEIPARIYVVGADNIERLAAGLTVMLNANRSENVVADVRSIKRLRGQKMTMENIAKELGMSLGLAKKRAKLLDLPKWLEDAFFTGKIPHSVVQEIAGSDADRMNAYRKLYTKNGTITVADIKAMKKAGVGADELSDAADDSPTAAAATGKRTANDIRRDLRLDSAVLAFLQRSLSDNGIAMVVNGESGEIVITRGNEVLTFVASFDTVAGDTPATAEEIEQPTADDAPEGDAPDETPDTDDPRADFDQAMADDAAADADQTAADDAAEYAGPIDTDEPA
jgi:ParB/RepB/Spo0J family partition protein